MTRGSPEFSGIRFVTFDCYGTLVDWFGGVASFVRALLARRNRRDVDPLEFVAAWERIQRRLIEPPYRRYGEILEASLCEALARHGLAPEGDEARAFAASMGDWPPFREVPDALRRAAALRPLVLVSNTDRATLDRTKRLLAAPIHRSITAEDSRQYKPAVEAFSFAILSLGARPSEVLHVSAYDDYDLIPAARLGMRTIGVSREGAPNRPSAPVDAMISSLAELPGILAGLGGGGNAVRGGWKDTTRPLIAWVPHVSYYRGSDGAIRPRGDSRATAAGHPGRTPFATQRRRRMRDRDGTATQPPGVLASGRGAAVATLRFAPRREHSGHAQVVAVPKNSDRRPTFVETSGESAHRSPSFAPIRRPHRGVVS